MKSTLAALLLAMANTQDDDFCGLKGFLAVDGVCYGPSSTSMRANHSSAAGACASYFSGALPEADKAAFWQARDRLHRSKCII